MKEADIRNLADVRRQFDYMAEDIERMFLTPDGNLDQERILSVPCVVCGTIESDRLFIKMHFPYQTCSNCSMVYVNPRPLAAALDDYYQHSKSFNYFVNKTLAETREARQRMIMRTRARRLVEALNSRLSKPHWRILEVGSGSGLFSRELMAAAPEGVTIELIGVEPSPSAVEQARAAGFAVRQTSFEALPEDDVPPLDAVISFEVVEHLFEPMEYLRKSSRLLNSDGLLYFTTPNVAGFDNTLLEAQAPTFCPLHLNLFSPSSVEHFLRLGGFLPLEISTPGDLDVSIVLNRRESWPADERALFLSALDAAGPEAQHAFQQILRELKASSHMAVLARKVN